MRVIQAIGPSSHLADRKASVQRTINMRMTEIEGVGEDKPVYLQSSEGLTQTLASGDLRGFYVAEGRAFYVVGTGLYELTSESASVLRGTLTSTTGYVSMAHGVSQLVIVDGLYGYVLNLSTNVFGAITSGGWRGSNRVEHIDGYFVFVDPDTEQFYISAIDDGSTLDALDFSSADTQPDNIVTHRVFKRELYLIGSRSIEVWINSGDPDFPFTRYNATPIQVGAVSPRGVVIASDTIFFVGQTDRGHGYVYVLNGYQPMRISTQAVEEAMRDADLSQCVMWSYHVKGAELVGIEAPGMGSTWVFDASSKQWHELGRYVTGEFQALGMDHLVFWNGEHYCGYQSAIHRIDQDSYTYGADALVRERTWPHLMSPSMEPVSYRCLELACSTGDPVGSVEGSVTLEISNDGGYTFGSPLQKTLGMTGQWMKRIRWMFLGSARDRVFRIRCADAVPFSIHSASVEAA